MENKKKIKLKEKDGSILRRFDRDDLFDILVRIPGIVLIVHLVLKTLHLSSVSDVESATFIGHCISFFTIGLISVAIKYLLRATDSLGDWINSFKMVRE